MTKSNRLNNYSIFYAILKKYIVFLFNRYYHVTFSNKPSCSKQDRLIYASNHHNALMDAVALHSAINDQPVFMARSDIFANKIAAKVLTFLKILPIYRIRDGYDQLSNNQQVFEQTFQVLNNNIPLAIFPEGNHDSKKRLRNLKKGIARIAFSYRSASVNNEIKVIPVGMNYSDYHQPGSSLLIRYGNAISLSDFDKEIIENPAKATNSFIKALETELKNNMLHIEEEEVYETCNALLEIYASVARSRKEHPEVIFQQQKIIIEQIETIWRVNPEHYQDIKTLVQHISEIIEQNKLSIKNLSLLEHSRNSNTGNVITLAITFPLYAYAFLQNVLPGLILKKIQSIIKDAHFKSSVNLVGRAFVYPMLYVLQTLFIGIITGDMFFTLLYLFSLPLSFVFMKQWEAILVRIKTYLKLSGVNESLFSLLRRLAEKTGITLAER